ncbi:MAG: hypothetical protein ACI4MK_02820 [Aristaeellaceae bacterium]
MHVIDTQACESYASQLQQVITLYSTVREWIEAELWKCAKITSEAQYVDMNDPSAGIKLAKANIALIRSGLLTKLNFALGTSCLIRLRNHFSDVPSRVARMEDAICARGEKLFDL